MLFCFLTCSTFLKGENMKTLLYLFADGSQFKFMGDNAQHEDFRKSILIRKGEIEMNGVLDITDRLVLNLGLENNPLDVQGCLDLLSEFGTIENSRVEIGEWEGKPERTLVVAISNVDLWSWELVADVRKLATKTTQDCIAFKYNGVGAVVNQVAPDTVIFDENYFINETNNV